MNQRVGEIFESFHNYTREMYEGNEPACEGHRMMSGGVAEKYTCKWGGGEVYKGEVLFATFSLNARDSVSIIGNKLWISSSLQSGVWQYCYNCNGMPGGVCYPEHKIHEMEKEKAERILNFKTEGKCKFWEIVQERAKELYEESLRNM